MSAATAAPPAAHKTVPTLSAADVKSKLDELIAAQRKNYFFALYGQGSEDRLAIDGAPGGQVAVLPVRSELELRRRLLETDGVKSAAFLVPWTGTVPVDLQWRFAQNGKVYPVGPDTRIRGLFGAVDSEPEVRSCPLTSYLLEYEAGRRFPAVGRLTEDILWRAWLTRRWGVDAAAELSLDALLAWAATSGAGAEFAQVRSRAPAVGEALEAYLEKRLGALARLAWTGWERGEGAELLQLAVLAAARDRAADDPVVLVWWETVAGELAGDESLTRQMAEVAGEAVRLVERYRDAKAARALVAGADARVIPSVRDRLIGSPVLPSAWSARLGKLAAALRAGAEQPTREAAAAAADALAKLWGHTMYRDEDQAGLLERCDMAVRLLGWLTVRPDRDRVRSQTPYTEVEVLSGWYADEGGFVDWARRRARHGDAEASRAGAADDAIGAAIDAVLAAADREREALDRAFARALPAYHDAKRPMEQCVPIDRAVDRIAGKFLAGGDERSLLVLLMDGMGWAQAAEILTDLGGASVAWGPLAWHAMAKHRIGAGAYPPVLANFPTVTEISRSGFFAGKAMAAFKDHKTGDDPKRWQANAVAKKFSDGTEGPKLKLGGEGHTKDGAPSPEALSLVGDKRHRVVGLVLNTIDDSLKAHVAHVTRWKASSIKALPGLLDAARDAGRAVLFCADHGHVPADRMEKVGGPNAKGARWRVWESKSDPVADYEVGLAADKDGVWAPKNAHGVVLMADDGHRYASGGHGAGEHGGASLAEVVAPCLLIGCEATAGVVDGDDDGQQVRPVAVPGWWHRDFGADPDAVQRGVTDEPSGRRKVSKRSKRPSNQLDLPQVPAPAPLEPVAAEPVSPSAGQSAASASPLAKSAVFKARASGKERDRVLQAVEFLRARNGVATAAAFASAMNQFPHRVVGFVAQLQEVLNLDGYQVVWFERTSQQVRLDVAKLAEQFEVQL